MGSNVEKQKKEFDLYVANVNDSRYRKIHEILKKSRERGEVLEIGCCGGEFLEVLRKEGWKVRGIEIAEGAKKKADEKKINVKIHDVNNGLPFEKNSFDVVIAGEIVEHTFDDVLFINECHRILKENGVLLLTTPNLISLKNRILMLFGYNPRFAIADYHYKVYTKKLLERLFKQSRFNLFKIKGNYVIYSKNREKVLGSLFESLGDVYPSLSEHFIVVAKKS